MKRTKSGFFSFPNHHTSLAKQEKTCEWAVTPQADANTEVDVQQDETSLSHPPQLLQGKLTVWKEVTGFQGSEHQTKNILVLLETQAASWLAGLESSDRFPLQTALRGPEDAEVCPLCVLSNSTSKRLVKKLIRATPRWKSELDRGWLLREVFFHQEDGAGGMEGGWAADMPGRKWIPF